MKTTGSTLKKEKIYYTEERFLLRILVDVGIYPSVSEIRRNKPELMIGLNRQYEGKQKKKIMDFGWWVRKQNIKSNNINN